MPPPNQVPKLDFSSLDPVFNQHYSALVDRVNSLLGYSGPVKIGNHLDLGGNRVMNVGQPQSDTDALPSGTAKATYSAPVLSKQLESTGSSSLRTYRQINNSAQREASSSFLNDLMSTTPSANGIYPSITNAGSTVDVVIPSSTFQFSDGSSVTLQGRTDVLSLPTSYSLTSISQLHGVVTAVFSYTGTPPLIAAGNVGTIAGVADSTYDYSGPLNSVVINTTALTVTVQYQQTTTNSSSTGGTFSTGGIYYYVAVKRSSEIPAPLGPYASDTAVNRLNACFDGSQIIAVVAVTSSGGQVANSGGGGSAITGTPTSGCFF